MLTLLVNRWTVQSVMKSAATTIKYIKVLCFPLLELQNVPTKLDRAPERDGILMLQDLLSDKKEKSKDANLSIHALVRHSQWGSGAHQRSSASPRVEKLGSWEDPSLES